MTDQSAYVTDSATAISSRVEDRDGRLFVGPSVLTRAGVDDYVGKEITGWQALGLDPARTYRLFRSPDELKRAVARMNMLPLTTEHVPVSATNHPEDKVIGAVGSDVAYNDADNTIRGSLSVWREPYISRVRSGDQKEISMGYRFRPDMTPGTWNGKPYDGTMTSIEPNHFALVPAGRVNINRDGPPAAVADAAPAGGKELSEAQKTPPTAKTGDEPVTGEQKNPLDVMIDSVRCLVPDVDDDKLRAACSQLIAELNTATPGAEEPDPSVGDEPAAQRRKDEKAAGRKANEELEGERKEKERLAEVGDSIRRELEAKFTKMFRDKEAARDDVRGVVGQAVMVGDTAGDIYRNSLKALGVPDTDKMGDDEARRTFGIVKAQRNQRPTATVGDSASVAKTENLIKELGLDRFVDGTGV